MENFEGAIVNSVVGEDFSEKMSKQQNELRGKSYENIRGRTF